MKFLLKDFYIDKEDHSLNGCVTLPEFPLGGARIRIPENLDIEGCVVQLFTVRDLKHVKAFAKGVHFTIGSWYVKILIDKGWEHIKSGIIDEFYLEEGKINKEPFKASSNSNLKSFLLELKNMSGLNFSNFYLDIRGGETGGVGRNEHGDPHFHVINKNSKKDLGKVEFPTVSDYKNNKTGLIFKADINRTQEKEISKWVFNSGLKNLSRLNESWKEMNKDNNRVIK